MRWPIVDKHNRRIDGERPGLGGGYQHLLRGIQKTRFQPYVADRPLPFPAAVPAVRTHTRGCHALPPIRRDTLRPITGASPITRLPVQTLSQDSPDRRAVWKLAKLGSGFCC